jgi:hypothetical protein
MLANKIIQYANIALCITSYLCLIIILLPLQHFYNDTKLFSRKMNNLKFCLDIIYLTVRTVKMQEIYLLFV